MGSTKIELAAYSTDASGIEGDAINIIFPENVEFIRQIVNLTDNILIRGGGSGLAGGAVPLNSTVLDLSKMTQIGEVDLAKKMVHVEAGVILDDLNTELEKYGLEFPVQPSSHAICTIGGMIATNAVGSRAIKYGRTSNWIEELDVVNGKGEVIKVMKNDIQDFTGLEGITGVIVKAKLRLIEKRERTASLYKISTLEEVERIVAESKLSNEVSQIEFLDKITSRFLNMGESYHVIVEYESDNGKLIGEDYEKLMALRDKVYPVLATQGYTRIEDPKIMLNKFRELAKVFEADKIPFFGHLGSGILHPVFKKDQESKIKEILTVVKKLHGQVTGEHGIGLNKKEFLDITEKRLIQRVKERHDPGYKFNVNKVINRGENLGVQNGQIS